MASKDTITGTSDPLGSSPFDNNIKQIVDESLDTDRKQQQLPPPDIRIQLEDTSMAEMESKNAPETLESVVMSVDIDNNVKEEGDVTTLALNRKQEEQQQQQQKTSASDTAKDNSDSSVATAAVAGEERQSGQNGHEDMDVDIEVSQEAKGGRTRRNYRGRLGQKRSLESGEAGSDSDSDLDDDDDDDDQSDSDDSNSDSSTTSNSHSNRESSESTKIEVSEDESDLKPLPPLKWDVLSYMRQRELGRCHTLTLGRAVVGSVSMAQRMERQYTLDHQHQGCVNTLHFNQAGNLLATGSDDLDIVLWDWCAKKPVLVYNSEHRSNVFQAKFMPYSGDSTIVSCARDGQVRVGHLSSMGTCKGTKKLAQHKGAAHKLGLMPDSPVVFLSCGEDSAVYEFDLREPKATKIAAIKEDDKKVALYSICVNPLNTNEFVVGGRDHFVRVYDRRKMAEEGESGLVKKLCPHRLEAGGSRRGHKANVTCAVYNCTGSEILASYNDDDIYLFDNTHSDGADSIHRYRGHRNSATVKGVNFYGLGSEFVVSGSDCGHVFLWEKETEKIVQYMKGDEGGVVNCLEPHPSCAVLATSGLDHDIKIWAPTAPGPVDLEGLKTVSMRNRKERERERQEGPDVLDGQMFWFIMQHLRRRARRRAREQGEMDGDDEDSSLSESDSPSEDDDDPDSNQSLGNRCATS